MLRLTLVVVSLLVASFASAQTVERSIDLSVLGIGATGADPIDTDGNGATEEWLVYAESEDGMMTSEAGDMIAAPRWYVVAVRPTGVCMSNGFDPRAFGSDTHLVQLAGRSKLVASQITEDGRSILVLVSLNTPTCQ